LTFEFVLEIDSRWEYMTGILLVLWYNTFKAFSINDITIVASVVNFVTTEAVTISVKEWLVFWTEIVIYFFVSFKDIFRMVFETVVITSGNKVISIIIIRNYSLVEWNSLSYILSYNTLSLNAITDIVDIIWIYYIWCWGT